MNYHIKCSKCPPLADTHASSCLQWSFTLLSVAFSRKANQIYWSAFLNFKLLLQLACDKTPALPPNLIIQWTEVGWIRATHHTRWSRGSLTYWNLKLEAVKTISTSRKLNVILLNIKINRPKLVSMCGYKLAANWQNITEIYLAWVKTLLKVLGELLFWLTL